MTMRSIFKQMKRNTKPNGSIDSILGDIDPISESKMAENIEFLKKVFPDKKFKSMSIEGQMK